MNKFFVALWFGMWTAVLYGFTIWLPAQADPAVGNGGFGRLPAFYQVVSSGTISLANARTFLGVSNLNTSIQLGTISCFDNASAASGVLIYQGAVGLTPPNFPAYGISLQNGLTCTTSTVLGGQGVAVYYR